VLNRLALRVTVLAVALAAAAAVAPLSAQRAPIVQQLVFTPYHVDGIYGVGETVGWTVAPAPAPPTAAFKWTIRRNNAVVLKEARSISRAARPPSRWSPISRG
jgi:hypothetical protein